MALLAMPTCPVFGCVGLSPLSLLLVKRPLWSPASAHQPGLNQASLRSAATGAFTVFPCVTLSYLHQLLYSLSPSLCVAATTLVDCHRKSLQGALASLFPSLPYSTETSRWLLEGECDHVPSLSQATWAAFTWPCVPPDLASRSFRAPAMLASSTTLMYAFSSLVLGPSGATSFVQIITCHTAMHYMMAFWSAETHIYDDGP